MNVQRFLTPHMERLYRDNDGITTAEAAAELREILHTAPGGDPAMRDELIDMALKQIWGGYYGHIRRQALRRAKRATVRQTFTNGHADLIVTELLQAMLPLPEGVKPLNHCALTELRRSIAFLRQQQRGVDTEIAKTTHLVEQMEAAIVRTGNFDLTVGEANDQGLIDWEEIAA